MTVLRRLLSALFLSAVIAGLGSASPALAAGGEKCLECHDEDDEPTVAINKTKHRTEADKRAPTCMACHGPSEEHIKKPNKMKPTIRFGKDGASAEERNAVCVACHQKDAKRMLWDGSAHETREVPCTSCHVLHTTQDKVRDKRAQSGVCFNCHKEQRAQVNKPSHHPIPEGKMSCGDCHNVHGSAGPKLVKRDSVVETCYTCHMEKRGPFLHNHEPVNEDCSHCHNPHGTVAESMLKMRPPFLCNSCHTPHTTTMSAPLLGPKAGGANWDNSAIVFQGRACANCHTQVHGSNNPDPRPGTKQPTPQFLFR